MRSFASAFLLALLARRTSESSPSPELDRSRSLPLARVGLSRSSERCVSVAASLSLELTSGLVGSVRLLVGRWFELVRLSGSIDAECRRLFPRRMGATAVPVDEVELWSEYRLLPDGDARAERGELPATVGDDFSIVGTWNRRIVGVVAGGGSSARPDAEPTLPDWLPELAPVRPLPVLVASLAVVGGDGNAPCPRE